MVHVYEVEHAGCPFCSHHYRSMGMGETELKATCEDVFINKIIVTQDGANYLESTCLQSQNLLWFEHYTGHITASKFLGGL